VPIYVFFTSNFTDFQLHEEQFTPNLALIGEEDGNRNPKVQNLVKIAVFLIAGTTLILIKLKLGFTPGTPARRFRRELVGMAVCRFCSDSAMATVFSYRQAHAGI